VIRGWEVILDDVMDETYKLLHAQELKRKMFYVRWASVSSTGSPAALAELGKAWIP
jgi:hypothetical protein